MAGKTSHDYHPIVRNAAWPTFLASIGGLLYAVLTHLDVPLPLTAPIVAAYGAFCALFNPTAGTDQDWFRLR